MAISVRNANIESYSKEKPQNGLHLCEVRDIRVKNGHQGEGLRFDVTVVEGPSAKGFQFSPCVYPNNARGNGRMTAVQAQAKEEGKILRWLGAILGYAGEAVFGVTQEIFDGAIARPVSPYAGRLVQVNVVPHVNGKGEQTCYYELYPVPEAVQAPVDLTSAPKVASAAGAPVTVPSAPPPPAPASTSAATPWAVFPPPGWAPHTNPASAAAGWYFCGQLVKHESDLRKGL